MLGNPDLETLTPSGKDPMKRGLKSGAAEALAPAQTARDGLRFYPGYLDRA